MRLSILLLSLIIRLSVAQKTEIRQVDNFGAIRVTSGIDVRLIKGDKPMVKIESSGIPMGDIITEVQGNTLKIGFRSLRIDGRNDVKIQATYLELDRITAVAAANIFSTEVIKSEALEIVSSAAASVELEVDVRRLSAEASTASSIMLSGEAVDAHFEASTSSSIDAYHLDADNVTASSSTASDVRVTVKSAIRADASTAGTIRYRGDPRKSNTTATTAGSIRKVN